MFPRLSRGASDIKPFKIDPDKPVPLRSFGAADSLAGAPLAAPADYRPPSLLERHGRLALLFLLLGVLVILALVRAFHHPRPPAAQPVYVESVGPSPPGDTH
jgi:hypothetical protein